MSCSDQVGTAAEPVTAAADDAAPNRHIAKSHDDTSEGAVHCFQDEFGLYTQIYLHFYCYYWLL